MLQIYEGFLRNKELLPQNRLDIWSLSDCNGIWTYKHLLRKRTLKHIQIPLLSLEFGSDSLQIRTDTWDQVMLKDWCLATLYSAFTTCCYFQDNLQKLYMHESVNKNIIISFSSANFIINARLLSLRRTFTLRIVKIMPSIMSFSGFHLITTFRKWIRQFYLNVTIPAFQLIVTLLLPEIITSRLALLLKFI